VNLQPKFGIKDVMGFNVAYDNSAPSTNEIHNVMKTSIEYEQSQACQPAMAPKNNTKLCASEA